MKSEISTTPTVKVFQVAAPRSEAAETEAAAAQRPAGQRCGSATWLSVALISRAPADADAGIEHRVDDVDQDVDQHEADGDDEDDALDHRVSRGRRSR